MSYIAYQIKKVIVINTVVCFLFLMYCYGLFVPKNIVHTITKDLFALRIQQLTTLNIIYL